MASDPVKTGSPGPGDMARRPAPAASRFRRRRYHDLRHFLRDLARVLRRGGLALRLARGLDAGFRERLMLVVTGVNRCRHCAYGHGIVARQVGLTASEISELLALDLRACPEHELPGLRHAIHFAETDGQPTAAASEELHARYGPDTARLIEMACLLIQIGNRVGNTWDWLLCIASGGRMGLLPEERAS